jgi:hypothetical protein
VSSGVHAAFGVRLCGDSSKAARLRGAAADGMAGAKLRGLISSILGTEVRQEGANIFWHMVIIEWRGLDGCGVLWAKNFIDTCPRFLWPTFVGQVHIIIEVHGTTHLACVDQYLHATPEHSLHQDRPGG